MNQTGCDGAVEHDESRSAGDRHDPDVEQAHYVSHPDADRARPCGAGGRLLGWVANLVRQLQVETAAEEAKFAVTAGRDVPPDAVASRYLHPRDNNAQTSQRDV